MAITPRMASAHYKGDPCYVLWVTDRSDSGVLPGLRGCGHRALTVSICGRELARQRGKHSPDNSRSSR